MNGLPQSAVNITLDGMNIQDNYAKTWDGMFTRVSPRLDAVEEISVGSAAGNAGDVGQGGVQVRFTTRSGTNQFRGSAYYYLQDDKFNTNTWFNLNRNVDATGTPTDKPAQHNDQPGFRIGGPIVKDKAFFFFNYEWISSPSTQTLRPTMMSPSSEQGIFRYAAGAPGRSDGSWRRARASLRRSTRSSPRRSRRCGRRCRARPSTPPPTR